MYKLEDFRVGMKIECNYNSCFGYSGSLVKGEIKHICKRCKKRENKEAICISTEDGISGVACKKYDFEGEKLNCWIISRKRNWENIKILTDGNSDIIIKEEEDV